MSNDPWDKLDQLPIERFIGAILSFSYLRALSEKDPEVLEEFWKQARRTKEIRDGVLDPTDEETETLSKVLSIISIISGEDDKG